MFFPVPYRLFKRCDRCGLQSPRDNLACGHCENLSDSELAMFLARREEEMTNVNGLGKVFLVLSVILLSLSIVIWQA